MTLANKLTISRVILIPIMIVCMEIPALAFATPIFDLSMQQLLFAILFVIASLTDFVDGYVARKYHQITTFGKFLDPIADKILVFTALIYLMLEMPARVPAWSVIIIIVREFLVTAVRLLAVEKGHVIAASKLGKYKTATTMLAIIWFLFNDFGLILFTGVTWLTAIGDTIYYIAVFFTVLSGWDYLYKNKKVILESI